jgi:hypothetical protein
MPTRHALGCVCPPCEFPFGLIRPNLLIFMIPDPGSKSCALPSPARHVQLSIRNRGRKATLGCCIAGYVLSINPPLMVSTEHISDRHPRQVRPCAQLCSRTIITSTLQSRFLRMARYPVPISRRASLQATCVGYPCLGRSTLGRGWSFDGLPWIHPTAHLLFGRPSYLSPLFARAFTRVFGGQSETRRFCIHPSGVVLAAGQGGD